LPSPTEITLDFLVARAVARGFNIIRVTDRSTYGINATLEHRRTGGGRSDENETFPMSAEALARFGDRLDREGRAEVVRYPAASRPQFSRMIGEEPPLAAEFAGTIDVEGTTVVFERSRFSQGSSWHLNLGFASFEQLVRWHEARTRALADAVKGRLSRVDGSDGVDDLRAYFEAHLDLEQLDAGAWAKERGFGYKRAEPMPVPKRNYRESLRRFREWTVAHDYFQTEDPGAPDAFYTRSDLEHGYVRFFVETDADLQERLMVERPFKSPYQSTGTLNDLRSFTTHIRDDDGDD
jgi:hypothetical protein